MTLDAYALAAWKEGRDLHGHSLTFGQAASVTYDPSTGANSETSATSTVVQGIMCTPAPGRSHVHDMAVEAFDAIAQVLVSELPTEPRVGESVEYDGTTYAIVKVSAFPFGMVECGLRGARE